MVTNNYDFKTITRLKMLCMKVLPAVYGDALSYEEQVCKVTEKINQLVDTINYLPDYIVEVVKELIEAAGLEDIIKQVLADLYFIDVKNPPAPFVAAKGDGNTNDTAAIQALINYASLQRSYLFFPAGNYLVNGLTAVENVSLIGLDRYSTTITLEPESNRDLITGSVKYASIANITLNANMNGQSENCCCLNATVENALIDFVIFKNGYDSVVIENNDEFEGLCWLFDGIQHNAITLNGKGGIISNVIFKNASQLSSNTLMVINGGNKISGIFSNVKIPNGAIISGEGTEINGTILNAITPITGGLGNYVNIETNSGAIVYRGNETSNYEDISITANNINKNVIGVQTVKADSYTETIENTKTTTAAAVNENVTGAKTVKADSYTETIENTKTTTAAAVNENVTGAKTVKADSYSEDINHKKSINAEDIILNPVNPLTYKTPTKLNDYFNTVPFKDSTGTTYQVLVDGEKDIPDYEPDSLDNNIMTFTGFNKAWQIMKVKQAVVMSKSIRQAYTTSVTSGETHFNVSASQSFPLDFPVANPSVAGGMESQLGYPTSLNISNSVLTYRVTSTKPLTDVSMTTRIIVSGNHATPPVNPKYDVLPKASEALNTIKTYLTARESGRKFAYGANFTYNGGKDVVNNADGAAMMECDTLVLMALMGINYSQSPYANTTPNYKFQFTNLTINPNNYTWVLPLQNNEIYGGRLTSTSTMNWYFWNQDLVFNSLALVSTGDVAIFRRANTTTFDNVGHCGMIELVNENNVFVPYVIHFSVAAYSGEVLLARVPLTQFYIDNQGRYKPEDTYFVRPNYA